MKIDFTLQDLDFIRQEDEDGEIRFAKKVTDEIYNYIRILPEENIVKLQTWYDGGILPLELSFAEVMALSKEIEDLID